MAGSCHCPAQRPLLSLSSPVNVKFPGWRRGSCVNPVGRTSRYLQPALLGWKSTNKKWKLVHVACFKHVEEEEEGEEEESSCSAKSFKSVEKQSRRLSNAESEQPVRDSNDHWFSKIRKFNFIVTWSISCLYAFWIGKNGDPSWTLAQSPPIIHQEFIPIERSKVLHKVFKSHGEPWSVPWSAETIIQVVLLWIASFWFIGSWIIPFLAHAAGFSKESLTYRGQALYSLLTDIVEGLAGIAILHRCLSRFRPLPSGWFRFSLKGNWQFDVVLGCLMFPLVNRLSQLNLDMVPMIPAPPVGVSSVEQSILARDPVAMALYAVVVSVCAPVWEEIVFRGFLLPSLTRYMPLRWAIIVSALAFALAHFNVQRLLPLVFLGVVMGAVFARTKNLLPSMLLHSLWNGFVFLDLMR